MCQGVRRARACSVGIDQGVSPFRDRADIPAMLREHGIAMTSGEEEFIERIGRHFEADGVPRIGGRLYGFLLLQDEPRSLESLAEALCVSKASISTNARLLVARGLVDRVSRPGDRRDYYALADDPARVLALRLQRLHEMSDLLAAGARAVSPVRSAAGKRLSRLARFSARAADHLQDLIASWFGAEAI